MYISAPIVSKDIASAKFAGYLRLGALKPPLHVHETYIFFLEIQGNNISLRISLVYHRSPVTSFPFK